MSADRMRAPMSADGADEVGVTARAIAIDGENRRDMANYLGLTTVPNGRPGDPYLAPDYIAPSADDARQLRAIVAPIVDSVRTFAQHARARAQEDDSRAAYANGAADAAMVVATIAADAMAQARRD